MSSTFISFCYPTLLRPGMTANSIYRPEPIITPDNSNDKHTLVVTAGMVYGYNVSATTQVDVLYNGSSVIDHGTDEYGFLENPYFRIANTGEHIYISSLFVNNVKFLCSGTYTISIKMLKNDQSGLQTDELLCASKCDFLVELFGGNS